jgi:signal transduction histidine kinase
MDDFETARHEFLRLQAGIRRAVSEVIDAYANDRANAATLADDLRSQQQCARQLLSELEKMATDGASSDAIRRYVAELNAESLSEKALEYVIAKAEGSNCGP